MRKAIVVALDVNALIGRKEEQAAENALSELNEYLDQGWKVVHSGRRQRKWSMLSERIW